jgi:hypothetical protein
MMILNFETALRAGVIGGTLVFVLLLWAKKMKLSNLNLNMLLGSTITKRDDPKSEMIGFFIYLAISALLAIGYAAAFTFQHASGWWQGWLFSIPHLFLTGTIFFAAKAAFPVLKQKLQLHNPPCDYHSAYTVFIVIVLHMVYGITVGLIYT